MLRKPLSLLALGLSTLLVAALAHAQTVDEILAKHYEAMGGLAKLKALNTLRITGTIAMGPGMDAPLVMERKRPGKRRVEFTVQGMTGIHAFDGEKAWSLMPFTGKKDPEAASEEENKTQKEDADFDGALVDWKEKGNTVELAGKESVDGADAFKLKVTKKNGNVETDFVDAETYLLVKTEGKTKFRGTEIEASTTFSDYKEVEGCMMPYSMEQGAKGSEQRQKFTFSKIELNVPLDDSRFSMPGPAAPADSAKVAAKADTTKSAATKSTDKKSSGSAAKSAKKKDSKSK